jgi:DNA topoisomerase-1
MKTLIIVESKGKIEKIKKLTGCDVDASLGHLKCLSPTLKWFDVENIQPEYINIKEKAKVIKNLKEKTKKYDKIIIASDRDREGEMIGLNICEILKLNPDTTDRIIFNEITEKALKTALQNPTKINMNIVNAQKARAVLDLVYGFTISPVLSKYIGTFGLSAGRVQSPALLEIYKRQKLQDAPVEKSLKILAEIDNFTAILKSKFTEKNPEKWLKNIHKFKVISKETKERQENPPPPFTTSSLQQTAYNTFGMTPKNTMSIAQKLYEQGLITYMRTDSVFLSNSFLAQSKNYINEKYGEKYSTTRQFANKGKSQNAHEAIRPTNLIRFPSSAPLIKLYNLIVNRTLASQISHHKFNEEITILKTNDDVWNISTKHTTFDGFKVLSNSIYNDKKFNADINDELEFTEVSIEEHEKDTKPPYNQSTAVKMMENEGIGRPSTYASILDKLQDRHYITIETNETKIIENRKMILKDSIISSIKTEQKKGGQKNCLILTELGKKVCEFFIENLEQLTSSKLTANLEENLDLIADGGLDWNKVIKDFHKNMSNETNSIKIEKNNTVNYIKIFYDKNDIQIGLFKTKYGLCLRKDENGKAIFQSIPTKMSKGLTTEDALNLMKFPKKLGDYEIKVSKYGYYVSSDGKTVNFDKEPKTVEEVKEKLNEKSKTIVKEFDEIWSIRNGAKGMYIMKKQGKPKFFPMKNKKVEDIDMNYLKSL